MEKDAWVVFLNNYLDYYAYESLEAAKKSVKDYIGSSKIISKEESRTFVKYFTDKDTFKIQLIKIKEEKENV